MSSDVVLIVPLFQAHAQYSPIIAFLHHRLLTREVTDSWPDRASPTLPPCWNSNPIPIVLNSPRLLILQKNRSCQISSTAKPRKFDSLKFEDWRFFCIQTENCRTNTVLRYRWRDDNDHGGSRWWQWFRYTFPRPNPVEESGGCRRTCKFYYQHSGVANDDEVQEEGKQSKRTYSRKHMGRRRKRKRKCDKRRWSTAREKGCQEEVNNIIFIVICIPKQCGRWHCRKLLCGDSSLRCRTKNDTLRSDAAKVN